MRIHFWTRATQTTACRRAQGTRRAQAQQGQLRGVRSPSAGFTCTKFRSLSSLGYGWRRTCWYTRFATADAGGLDLDLDLPGADLRH
jgi:hypothetical protein